MLGSVNGELDIGDAQRDHPLKGARWQGGDNAQKLELKIFQGASDDVVDKGPLVGEVPVDRARSDAGLVGDCAH